MAETVRRELDTPSDYLLALCAGQVETVIVIAAIVVLFAFFLAYPAWLKAVTRRRRLVDPDHSPPRPLAIVDELYHPDAHATRQIVESQREVPAEASAPGDPTVA